MILFCAINIGSVANLSCQHIWK